MGQWDLFLVGQWHGKQWGPFPVGWVGGTPPWMRGSSPERQRAERPSLWGDAQVNEGQNPTMAEVGDLCGPSPTMPPRASAQHHIQIPMQDTPGSPCAPTRTPSPFISHQDPTGFQAVSHTPFPAQGSARLPVDLQEVSITWMGR